jgi:lysophospholipase L1-like esterase
MKPLIHITRRLFLLIGALAACAMAAEPEFYTPERDRFDPAKDKPAEKAGLPKVLLIGDSIMGGYCKQVIQTLAKEANVDRHPGNAGDTRNGLKHIDEWLGDTKWDVIHFNWGLHDLCYRNPESKVYGNRDKEHGTLSVPLDEYARNLEQLVERLKKTGAKLVWATTTKVPEGEVGRIVGDEVKYNAAAAAIMRTHGIPVDDLYTVSATLGADGFSKPGDVHFSGKGNGRLAKQVVTAIRSHGLAGVIKPGSK